MESAYIDSHNAAGSSAKELETSLDSIQGKLNQMSAAFQNLWFNAIDSNVIKFFIDFGTAILNIVDNIGLLNAGLATVATVLSFNGVGRDKYAAPQF